MLDDDIHNLDCIETTEERNPSPNKFQTSLCDRNNLATVTEDIEPALQLEVIVNISRFFLVCKRLGWGVVWNGGINGGHPFKATSQNDSEFWLLKMGKFPRQKFEICVIPILKNAIFDGYEQFLQQVLGHLKGLKILNRLKRRKY
jgi:hypothetical protein